MIAIIVVHGPTNFITVILLLCYWYVVFEQYILLCYFSMFAFTSVEMLDLFISPQTWLYKCIGGLSVDLQVQLQTQASSSLVFLNQNICSLWWWLWGTLIDLLPKSRGQRNMFPYLIYKADVYTWYITVLKNAPLCVFFCMCHTL